MTLQDASLPLAPTVDPLPDDHASSIEFRGFEGLIARSPAMRTLLQELERLRDSPLVLLRGETGTGKDFLARFLYQRAAAGSHPFRELDSFALDSARLAVELDGSGPERIGRTVLIREVAELPVELQCQLLEALDSVAAGSRRIVCSTQKDLDHEAAKGRFLPALWKRLQPVTLQLPPLRERLQDLPDLIRHFLQDLADRYGRPPVELTRDTWQVLLAHRWDGNVRELRNEIERLVVFAPDDGPVGVTGLSAALQPEPRSESARRVSRLRRRNTGAAAGWRRVRLLWPGRSSRRLRRRRLRRQVR